MTNALNNGGTSYLGVRAPTPPNFISVNRDPTGNDRRGFRVGDFWQNSVSRDLWRLAGFDIIAGNLQADWLMVSGGAGDVITLTSNSGGAVPPDAMGTINVVGDGVGLTGVGVAGTNTITFSLIGGGIAAQSFPTGPGVSTTSGTTAVPSASGVLNILGAHNVDTGGAVANTVTVFGTNTITVGDLADRTLGQDSITVTSGNITIAANGTASSAGNLILPENSDATQPNFKGRINKVVGGNLVRWIHNTGINSIYIGAESGPDTIANPLADGIQNTALGAATLQSINSTGAGVANGNVAIGGSSLQNLTTGNNNVVVGGFALLTTGDQNTGIGERVGQDSGSTAGVTTGSRNTFVGAGAGSNYTSSESDNILIGSGTGGTVAESNTLRIGGGTGAGSSQLNRCFISGIRGITTGVADAVNVLIDSANQLGTVSSSVRYKQNIKDLGNESSIIYDLRPVTFNYKQHPDVPAWGLIAEEVADVFPQLVVFKDNEAETVKYHDLVPLLLNEIIKLKKEIDALRTVCNMVQ